MVSVGPRPSTSSSSGYGGPLTTSTRVAEPDQLAREVAHVDALAAAVRLAAVGQQRDAQGAAAVGRPVLLGHARSLVLREVGARKDGG